MLGCVLVLSFLLPVWLVAVGHKRRMLIRRLGDFNFMAFVFATCVASVILGL
jgi:hypothetical protein